jgi:Ca2+-binding RTX toxin-like protein
MDLDTVSYLMRSASVTVSLDDVAGDGAAGEGDNVGSTIENARGGQGNDSLSSPAPVTADNTLVGGLGNDTLVGGLGNDTLVGLDGTDVLRGGGGNDLEQGGDGNDTFDQEAAANGADTFVGGLGTDVLNYAGRTTDVSVTQDAIADDGWTGGEGDNVMLDIESITGGSGNDRLVGGSVANTLTGGFGVDTLIGGAGNDNVQGGEGDDSLNTVDGVQGNDRGNGGNGTDTCAKDTNDNVFGCP